MRTRRQSLSYLTKVSLQPAAYHAQQDCTQPLKMLTVFNNIDAGELTMLDKILGFPMDVVLASTGLDEVCASYPFHLETL